MKELKQYISEWKLTSDNNSSVGYRYKYCPTTLEGLRDIISNKLVENSKAPNLLDIDTSKITDMYKLFCYFSTYKNDIEILDLHTWNMSNVKTTVHMFSQLENLKYVNVTGWDVSNVENMSCMFYDCSELVKVEGIETWKTKSVKDVIDMFANCYALESLNLKNWDSSNIERMSEMFWKCTSLKRIDNISNWTINSTSLSGLFLHCESLEVLDLSNWTFKVELYDIGRMFMGCKNLKKIEGIHDWPVQNALTGGIFDDCYNLSYYPRWYKQY